jgi:aspartyl-tRNA synthetase
LVYDSNQDILLSGEAYNMTTSSKAFEWLYVQCGKTGKRLPPVRQEITAILSKTESYFRGSTVSTRLSLNGRYFVIAYEHWFFVWLIDCNLFKSSKSNQRLTSKAWATCLMAHNYAESIGLDDYSSRADSMNFLRVCFAH